MIDLYKQLIANQFEAAFCTLGKCVELCPEASWRGPVVNLTFSQAVFHAIFYADVYLGPDFKSLKEQPFHKEHAAEFGDYEEREDRPQQAVYEKTFVNEYLTHCRDKATQTIAGETEESLARCPGFDWLRFSRAEVHVYNIRHVHHHAAQLSLRLRIDHGIDVPWVGSGWRD